MPCIPLAPPHAGLTHPLSFGSPWLRPPVGGAGQPSVALAAAELPPQFTGAAQQAGLALHRDPLAALPGQVPDAAQTGSAVNGPDAAGHFWSWKETGLHLNAPFTAGRVLIHTGNTTVHV